MADIWGEGTRIPILGVTGEKWSGKTLLVSGIDPENTKMIDLEKSSETYNIPFKERVDLYEALNKRPGGNKPIDAFLWFKDEIEALPTEEKKFTVIAVDPISDIEQGLVEWVQQNPEEFGHTAAQYARGGGIMWGDVKSYWKTFLGMLSTKCETFAFTTHMGAVWKGSAPTSQRKPKGKETLFELASLYIELDRPFDQQGKQPDKPKARVLKSRLSKTAMKDGELTAVPILPPTFDNCTAKTIRGYIQKPFGLKKQAAEHEKRPPKQMSDDDRLETQAQIAADKKAAAEAELAAAELKQVTTDKMIANAKARTEAEDEALAVKDGEADKADLKPESTEETHDAWWWCAHYRKELNVSEKSWLKALEKRGAKTLASLTEEQATELGKALASKLDLEYMAKN